MAPSLDETPTTTLPHNGSKLGTTSACCYSGVDSKSASSQQMRDVKNPSLHVTKDRTIKMAEAPILRPGPGDALIHVKVTGICGSDVHFWRSGKIGTLTVDGDCILGHEAAGIVLEVGEGVTTLKKGDRVAMEPQVPCGTCFLCSNGNYNLCDDVQFAGVYPYHGSLQRYKVHPARWLHKIPDNVTYSQGALLEPLSVVMHGITRTRLALGRGAVVCGAGPIGLIALAAARASGAHPIVITDLEPRRLKFAKEFVPSCQRYQIDRSLDAQGNARGIRKLFGETEYHAPETILECTGVESSIVTAAYTVRRGGDLMVIGVGKDIMNNLPFMHISLAEINLKFINRYSDTWPSGIRALEGEILDLDKLVTHTFPLEEAISAMELCGDITKGSIKVHVVDDRDDVGL
ncbi:putative alcohol dehydrogenase [Amylocarpus encephaloides]|uniref:Alcohol dehydrogenase n=1 Tax=Amylocarpus encephaloides TaxID=45428 RepID=A0A9P7YMD2_9HELO|nr:putative alcohol dehydrogenase [Amylocarpus encephaloides]